MLDDPDGGPQLVSADEQHFPIPLGPTTIGRDAGTGLQLSDPTVGRRHAELDATTAFVTLTDLQSTNGTWVNGRRLGVGEVVRLSPGDIVRLGATQLRFAAPAMGPVPNDTAVMGAVSRDPASPQVAVRHQQADQLNNVIGDQYNQYVRTVVEQRESFLREVAASRTRAKRLIWLGFLLYIIGAGAFLWMIIGFVSRAPDVDPSDESAFDYIWGQELGGVPIGFIGFGVAAVGTVVLIVGIALHIGATSRQRRMVSQPVMMPSSPTMSAQGFPYHRPQ